MRNLACVKWLHDPPIEPALATVRSDVPGGRVARRTPFARYLHRRSSAPEDEQRTCFQSRPAATLITTSDPFRRGNLASSALDCDLPNRPLHRRCLLYGIVPSRVVSGVFRLDAMAPAGVPKHQATDDCFQVAAHGRSLCGPSFLPRFDPDRPSPPIRPSRPPGSPTPARVARSTAASAPFARPVSTSRSPARRIAPAKLSNLLRTPWTSSSSS